MEKYCFFSEEYKCKDSNVLPVRTFKSDKFRFSKLVGELFSGLTGEQILNNNVDYELNETIIDRINDIYGLIYIDDLYEKLKREDFLDLCAKNRDYYLYPVSNK